MSLETVIGQWGLPGLFIGGLLEGEGAGFVGGLLAHRHFFSFPAAALSLAAGGLLADQLACAAGRLLRGRQRIARMMQRPGARKLQQGIAAHPLRWAFLIRWLYGLRTLGYLSLGMAGVPWPLVLAADALASVLWGFVITGAGFGLSQLVLTLLGPLPLHHHLAIVLAGGLLAALAIWLAIRRWRWR